MKWMIASDIHGSALYCDRMLDAFRREGAGRLLLLGDLLYHGPRNDLPEGYAPKMVISQLSSVADRVFCVRGNCEAEVDQMVLPHGHTHVPAKVHTETFWYLNPGSVSLPKENSPHGYMTVEDGIFVWKNLEGVEYDRLTL